MHRVHIGYMYMCVCVCVHVCVCAWCMVVSRCSKVQMHQSFLTLAVVQSCVCFDKSWLSRRVLFFVLLVLILSRDTCGQWGQFACLFNLGRSSHSEWNQVATRQCETGLKHPVLYFTLYIKPVFVLTQARGHFVKC